MRKVDNLGIWHLGPARHGFFVDRTAHLHNLSQLIEVTSAGEDWMSKEHFPDNASDSPHIYRASVGFQPEQQFRRSVPSSDNTVGVFLMLMA
jgi:hypothetical protein